MVLEAVGWSVGRLRSVGLVGSMGLLLALALVGCGGEADPPAADPAGLEDVVMTASGTTTALAERILGDRVPVVCPLPAGTDPATWFPTRDVLERYQRARLVVVNGAGYERWVAHVSLAPSRLVDVSAGFESEWLTFETTTHSHGTGGEHTHEGTDAHTWMDPSLARRQVTAMRDAFLCAWPEHEDAIRAGAAAVDAELAALGRRLDGVASAWQGARVFSDRPAYGYLARRLGGPVTDLGIDTIAPDGQAAAEVELASALEAAGGDGPALMLWGTDAPAAAEVSGRAGLLPVVYPLGADGPEPGAEDDALDAWRSAVGALERALLRGTGFDGYFSDEPGPRLPDATLVDAFADWPVEDAASADWDLRELVAEVAPDGLVLAEGDAAVQLLAWRIVEDARPLRVENALVVAEMRDEAGDAAWFVAVVFRQPDHADRWAFPWVSHVPVEPSTVLDRAPTRRDVLDVVNGGQFLFTFGGQRTHDPADGWAVKGRALVRRGWALVGGVPTRVGG